jgi:Amt family ammonium transporter
MESRYGCSKYPNFGVSALLLGSVADMANRIVGAVFIIGWNIVWTSLIMCFIKYVLRIPLRMTEEQLLAGDDIIHGEAAYVLGPCDAHGHLLAGHYTKRSETGPGELGMGGIFLGLEPQKDAVVGKSSGSGDSEIKHD